MKWCVPLGVAGILVVFFARGHAQQPAGRELRIAPSSTAALRDWSNVVDGMLRTNELRILSRRDDTLLQGRTIERLAQFFKGVRVWGGSVSRQLSGPSVVSVFGTIYQGIDLDPAPGLNRDAAAERLAGTGGQLLNPASEPELIILPLENGFRTAWMATVRTPTDVVRVLIDANSGAIVQRYSLLQRQAGNSALVRGFGVLGDEKKVSVTRFSGTFLASDALRPPAIETYDMRGNLNRTVAVLSNLISLATADLASSSATNWNDSAAVDAHTYAGYTYDYFFKRFGRRGFDNADRPLTNIVHPVRRADIFNASSDVLDTFYLNAFYCGECAGGVTVFGEGLPGGVNLSDGQHWNFLAGGLDVVSHELTHGVTDFSSRLEYVNESGALNEAFSDIMGTSVEFFFQKPGNGQLTIQGGGLQADYLIAEDVITGPPGGRDGIRSLADPALYGQPDHYSRLVRLPPDPEHDNGGVHINSGIPNHAFYLAIEGGTNRVSGISVRGVGGSNREQIEKVFYRAFVQLMPSNANFSMARAVSLQAAQDLYGAGSIPYGAVRDAWIAVGVN